MILDAAETRKRFLLRMAGVRDGKVYIGPEIVHLHMTTRCNLSCAYCSYHPPGYQIGPDRPMDFSLSHFLRLIDEAVKLRSNAVYLSGEGEPTMHPHFREMISALESAPIETTLFTNATYDPRLSAELVKADRLIVNLSAANPKSYLEMQGRDLFERVLENLRILVHLRDTCKPGLRVEISFVSNRRNAGELQELQKLGKQLGVCAVNAVRMLPTPYSGELGLDVDQEREAVRSGAVFPLCYNGWFNFVVSVDGKVSLCCSIDRMVKADFYKSSLVEIWNSKEFQAMRAGGARGVFHQVFPECRNCFSDGRNRGIARNLGILPVYG